MSLLRHLEEGTQWRMRRIDRIRIVKWAVVILLAVWLLRLFISWLRVAG